MKLLIKRAKIIDSSSAYNDTVKDILIEDDKIVAIDHQINRSNVETIQADGLHVSQGWVDLKAHFCDPGSEHKETITSGLNAATHGGFTHVAIVPSTQPAIDGKTQVEYLLRKNADHITQLHPIGAISQELQGVQMTEMFDMYQAGVQLFSDDTHFVSPQMMLKSLLYTKNFGATIVGFPRNTELAMHGVVNEGTASLRTGLSGDPHIAEIIEVERNIRLLEYTQGKLHLTGISCAQSVDLVRNAKMKNLNITADVHLANLIYTEKQVLDFDTKFKVLPVLRTENDRQALWQGIKDGTIDTIVSNHRPNDTEDKNIEFDNAAFGTIQLQTMFGNLGTCKEFEINAVVNALGKKARKILNVQENPIEVGNVADMTLFIPSEKCTFRLSDVRSKVNISPDINKELMGKVVGIVNGGNYHCNS